MKGEAAIFTGSGYEIRELPVPEPEPGAVLVRLTMAGVCGSDLHHWRGEMSARARALAGRVGGHEMTGRVARLGGGVTTDSAGRPLRDGDRIAYPYFFPCGRCQVCLAGDRYACPARLAPRGDAETPPYFTGAYAEYYHLPPGGFVFKVPDELPDEMVAPLNCALCQVIFSLHQAQVRFGETVVIQGAGGLGLSAVAVAREMGAGRIIVIDAVPARLALAERFGADATVDLLEYDMPKARIDRVRELNNGNPVDLACDFVGRGEATPEGIAMLRAAGRYLSVGTITQHPPTIDPSTITAGSRRVIGVATYDPWVVPAALDFLLRTRDRYPFDEVVSHRFPLDQINEAFQQAEWAGRTGEQTTITRAVIVP
jgi:L-iditol 2-dehydrogenase